MVYLLPINKYPSPSSVVKMQTWVDFILQLVNLFLDNFEKQLGPFKFRNSLKELF